MMTEADIITIVRTRLDAEESARTFLAQQDGSLIASSMLWSSKLADLWSATPDIVQATAAIQSVPVHHWPITREPLSREIANATAILNSGALTANVVAIGKQLAEAVGPTLEAIRSLATSIPALEELASIVSQASRPGTLWGDFLILLHGDKSPEETWSTICRMQGKWFKNPVHPKRWHLIKHELARRAADNGTTMQSELSDAVRQGPLLAVHDVGDEVAVTDLLQAVRAALANRVTDDLAGPGWRKRHEGVELVLELDGDTADDRMNTEFQAEIAELQRWFWAKVAELPKRQRAALLAKLEGRTLTNAEHQAFLRLRRSSRWTALQEAAS